MENNKIVIWVCFQIKIDELKDPYYPVYFNTNWGTNKKAVYDGDRYSAIETYVKNNKNKSRKLKYFRLAGFEFDASNVIDMIYQKTYTSYNRINPIEVIDYKFDDETTMQYSQVNVVQNIE